MSTNRIRPLAICVVRDGDRILVEHGFDSAKNQHFYRPLGGAIEFGEPAVDALRREFREELGAELIDVCLLQVLENLFEYEGKGGHEIVFIFEGRFADARLNQCDELAIKGGDAPGRASWMTRTQLKDASRPLYPTGLLALLEPS